MSRTISARTKLIVLMLIVGVYSASSPARATAQATRLRVVGAMPASAESPADPAAILSAARLLYVFSRTGLVKAGVIESELQKRAELQQAGLLLTRDPNAADLMMEVRRSVFTTEYPYVVIDTKTQVVVASGKVNSLFGTAASKIAKSFAKQVKQAHTSNPNK